jgi:SAM-dependent methyltransferase
LRPERRLAFGSVATLYELGRPGYAPDAITALGLGPGTDVVDLGAGTGKLTRQLVATGASVVAVEPDAAMRAQLLRAVSGVEALAGSAEAIPIPGGSADAVVAGQAYHWFEPGATAAELARVLRAGGVVAALWNHWRATGVAAADRLIDDYIGLRDVEPVPPDELAGFAAWAGAEFTHAQELDAEGFAAAIGSTSAIAVLPDDERAAVAARARRAAAGGLTIPYVTAVWVARRLA